jgi:hypothetical protein
MENFLYVRTPHVQLANQVPSLKTCSPITSLARTSNEVPSFGNYKLRDKGPLPGTSIKAQTCRTRLANTHTRKNLTSCGKSANKPSTSCVRTACPKLSTSLEQAVNNL